MDGQVAEIQVRALKTVTSALKTYLDSLRPIGDAQLFMGDLYTITLANGSAAGIANGTVLALSSLDVPVAWNSLTYLANSIMIDGLKYKASLGVNADTQQITLDATPSMTFGGVPFMQALQQGLFDGAEIQRERAFFTSFAPPYPLTPIGTIILFKGRVTEINSVGRTQAKVTIASDLTLLSIDMPRRLYQTNCVHNLYDTGCTLNRATYTATGALGAGSTTTTLIWSSATSAYQQGSITFTSGANEGITATVKTATTGVLTLQYPLVNAPATGDTFTISQGCDHTMTTCNSKFANLANFLGFPFVPPPQILTGPLASTSNGGKG